MWVTIGGVSVVEHVDGDSIAFNASVSDPESTYDFSVDDPLLQYALDDFQEVIVWDETQTNVPNGFGGTIALIPSVNYVLNPSLVSTGSGNYYNSESSGAAPIMSFPGTGVQFAYSNIASGQFSNCNQDILSGLVIPGVLYMLSAYVQASAGATGLTNAAFLTLTFYDGASTILSQTFTTVTPTTSQQRINVQAVAPAGTVRCTISLGAQSQTNTNSGTVTYTTAQFEPMWFVDQGVSYPTPDCNFSQITCVQLPNGTTSRKCRIFAGMIDDLEITYAGNQRFYAVSSIANSVLLEDYALINSSYTSEYDTFIINDVINTFFSGVISIGQQNVQAPLSTIVQGQLIPSVVHVDQTFREVLNFLSNTSGFLFYLDPYYYLHYVPQYYDVAVFQLSDTPDFITTFPYESYTLQKDGTTRGNAIKLTGNKQNAAAITDTFTGDGVTTVFNLTKPPYTVHTVTINGTRQSKVGVDGVDVNGVNGIVALVNKQKQIITFNGAPINASTVVVDYTYEDAVIAVVQSGDSYAKYRRWFWRKVNDSNMTSTTAATQRGIAEITKYAFPAQIPKLTTNNLYIPVGSTVLLTSQHDNLSQVAFTVQTVAVTHLGGGFYQFQYQLGRYNPTLIDHFRNTHKALNRPGYTSNVQVIVTYDSVLFDTVTWNDLCVPTNTGYAYTVLQDTPIRWYRLDDQSGTSAKDVGSQRHNGIYQGGYTLNVAGLLAHSTDPAASFNGSTGLVSLPLSGLPTGASIWSMEAWVNLAALPSANNYMSIIGWGTRSTGEMATLQVFTNGSSQTAFLFSGFAADFAGTFNVVTGTIYHVAATYDGTTVRLYVNGVQQASSAETLNVTLGFATIGANGSTASFFLNGTIDEGAIYTTTLSAARILAHYQAA